MLAKDPYNVLIMYKQSYRWCSVWAKLYYIGNRILFERTLYIIFSVNHTDILMIDVHFKNEQFLSQIAKIGVNLCS